jgi:cell division GTPase FtsZ
MINKDFEDILRENEKLEKELQQKVKMEEHMTTVLVEQQDRSVNFGVVGIGQAGSRIAEQFYQRGYDCVVLNTAMQDLNLVKLPEKQKLFLDYALGGAAKDLTNGESAVAEYTDIILDMLKENFADNEILVLATSGGGGTGSGGAENLIRIMVQMGKPVVVIYILPLSSEDTLAKHNSIQTLARLSKMAKGDTINSLIVVDNAKIEVLHPGLPISKFWDVANEAIVEPLHLFNMLSATPSAYTSLDSMDFVSTLLGSDCSLYGTIDVKEYLEEESIASAIVQNLKTGLLADEFDLKQTRSAGIIITASKDILDQIPAANMEFGFSMLNKICSDGTKIYRGIYEIPGQNVLRVYSLFSGLGLPEERVQELKLEAERHMEILKNKEENRASNMTIDIGKTQVVSAADQMYNKIKSKNSAMGKIKRNSKRIIDRRRK